MLLLKNLGLVSNISSLQEEEDSAEPLDQARGRLATKSSGPQATSDARLSDILNLISYYTLPFCYNCN